MLKNYLFKDNYLIQKNMNKKNIFRIAVFLVGSLAFFSNSLAQTCPSNTTVGETTATLVGELTDMGGDPSVNVWFQYGLTTSYGSNTPVQSKNETGLFCATITNLSPCTTYNFRAIAENTAGTSYGVNRTFTTTCLSPTVDFKADGSTGPITIPYNTSSNLTWNVENAGSCQASGAWSGTKSTSGSQSTGNLGAGTYIYTLTCTGPGGSESSSVTINVSNPPLPTVDLKANNSNGPINLYYGNVVNLSWTTENTSSCIASGDWSGAKSVSGSTSVQLNAVKTFVFTLTCQNIANETEQDLVQVVVSANPPVVITKPAVVTF